ncbi:MAG: hypothetical protein IAF38_21855 [Bacteroidia bacterium]|nr:hypothetical protein [Bacteroidia bacterium]
MEEEVVIYIADNMRCWSSRKPGMTKFGTYLGRIMITNQRFLFVSSGGSKIGAQIGMGLAFGNILGPLMLGKSLTKDLDLSALQKEGSFVHTFDKISTFKPTKRWDFISYLTIIGDNQTHCFLKDPFGYGFTGLKKIVDAAAAQTDASTSAKWSQPI